MSTLPTSTSSLPPLAVPPEVTFPERRRFTREAYYQMAESGAIGLDEKVELLNGEIVPMSPVGPKHCGTTNKLNRFFNLRLGERFICSVQHPQAADEYSEPEPDLQLLLLREDYYSNAHPAGAEVALAIEVAETSLKKDLGPKMRIYAAAGIIEYWVVDLINRKLVIHTEPDQQAAIYKTVVTHNDTAKVAPGAATDCELDLAWLFGPKKPA